MDVNWFLKQRAIFVRQYYSRAAEPFQERIRLIEDGESPFEPPYSEDDEPPFLKEWVEAKESLDILGASCLSMLSESLKLYFRTWEVKLGLQCQKTFPHVFKKRGFLRGYIACFGQTLSTDWSDCPADLDLIEQIALARNDSQHQGDITSLRLRHAKATRDRFPSPFFLSDEERQMMQSSAPVELPWLLGLKISVNEDQLAEAIRQVELLADWMEED